MQATRKTLVKSAPNIDILSILVQHNLIFVEDGFFRGKEHIIRLKSNNSNKTFILKTGRIDKYQLELLQLAKKIEHRLFFRVPEIIDYGEGYILMEEISGEFLNTFYEKDIEYCVRVSRQIADSYQVLIDEVQKQKNTDIVAIRQEAEEWFLSRLNMWSKLIIDAGMIEFSLVKDLIEQFDYYSNRPNFFGWVHGNIIGDHIILSDGKIYLLDLCAKSMLGGEYYDFLRAIDFMLLKSSQHKEVFRQIPHWINTYLSEFDQYEVRFVLAFRAIGLLGWDILQHNVEYTNGDLEEKKSILLQIIKGEY